MQSANISVAIPLLLGNATNGAREVRVTGATLRECLDDLMRQYPTLRTHLFEQAYDLRKHVLILYNQQNSRWLDSLDVPVSNGDTITILQAVSGG